VKGRKKERKEEAMERLQRSEMHTNEKQEGAISIAVEKGGD